jgi:putative peptidoglycan lipid II flippase
VLGLVRDRIFARTFGAGPELDAYNAAFVLPELTLGVLVASGLAAPFVPIFLGLRREDGAAAAEFAQTILTGAVLVMGLAAAVMFVFAEATASLIAPGFDAEERALYAGLFRLMLVTPIVFAASTALGEVLVAERRFFAYGLAPLLYNGGIVIGTVALAGSVGIYGAAIGAVIGAALHLAIRLWGVRGTGVRPLPRLAVHTTAVRDFVRLMLPKMLSQPGEQLTFLFFTAVASSLAAGSISAISFARNFQSVGVSLVGVAFSLAVFPVLSAAYAAGDRPGFASALARNLLTVSALTVGGAIFVLVVGRPAIETFLGGGAFDAADVALTSAVLSAFAVSIPLESVTHVLSRAIYATRHTLLQVAASLTALFATVGATMLLVAPLGILAVPVGFSIGQAVKVALLALVLVWRLRRFSAEVDASPADARDGRPAPPTGSSARPR